VAEADQVERLLATIPGDRPLTAVFPLAGVMRLVGFDVG
jgi:hypothetical protein